MTPDPKLLGAATPSAPAAEFADAMSALASGAVLVTCRLDGRPWGMTATAFASVAVAPPTVLVSLESGGSSARAVTATGGFGVSILSAEHVTLARYGSEPGAPKYLEAFVDQDAAWSASPAVAGALAHVDCELVEAVRIADHTVVFGDVLAVSARRAGTPLVYHRRRYTTLAGGTLGCHSS